MEYVIETENLTKQYGAITVVDNINLHVPKGKIYGLLGRNGAGKTTAMKMMLRLVYPTTGAIQLFGTNSKEYAQTAYKTNWFYYRNAGFYDNLTGRENLQILAKLRGGLSTSKIAQALEAVGLENENHKIFSDYSLGMKQRLGIAAAILHEPKLLILDEPINGLDPIGISEIRSFLSELNKKKGTTIFISSHILSEIEQIANIIGVMHRGSLVEEVNMAELHKRNRKYIEFEVSDSKAAEKIIIENYGLTKYSRQEKVIKIFDFSVPVEELNKTFVKNGLSVTGIVIGEENLEEYFSNLIGGGGIA